MIDSKLRKAVAGADSAIEKLPGGEPENGSMKPVLATKNKLFEKPRTCPGSITKTNQISLDEATQPLKCQCATCGSPAVIYPRPEPHGVCVCPKCSPAWLASFALFATNQFRQQHGLEAVTA